MAYNSPEEYLAAVQKQIRWKRAQKVVLEELRQHIDDQVDTFISQGMNSQEAIQHAIVQMGDPITVGLELDRIHRPKTDFGLVFLTIGLITIGILSSFLMNSSLFSAPKILGFCLGTGLTLVLYFSDYTVLFRYPKILYMGYTVLALLLSAFELRNGIYARGYSFAFYLMLFYPVLLVGMLYYFKNSGNSYRTTFYVLCLCVPIALSVVHQSLSAFIILTFSSCFLYYYGLQKKWLPYDLLSVCIFGSAILLSIGIFILYAQTDFFGKPLFTTIQTWEQLDFLHIYQNAALIGESMVKINPETTEYLYDHSITLLIQRYGRISAALLLVLFSLLLFLLFKRLKRQNTEIGKIFTGIILLMLTLQTVLAVLSDTGLILDGLMNLPFVITGGTFFIYDMCLIGFLLSVTRNESIAKDWITLKNRGGNENV